MTKRPPVEATAALSKLRDLHPRTAVTPAEAAQVAAVAVAAAPATQVRRPWRSTVRTAFQVLAGLLPMLPVIVGASGLDQSAPAVAGALAISAAITRVMALPAVEAFLQRFIPWLAAAPRTPLDVDEGAGELGSVFIIALGIVLGLVLFVLVVRPLL
jgi:hypothetical protein